MFVCVLKYYNMLMVSFYFGCANANQAMLFGLQRAGRTILIENSVYSTIHMQIMNINVNILATSYRRNTYIIIA